MLGAATAGLGVTVVLAAPLGAASAPKSFCAAVRTFNAARPSSKDEAVAALNKLAAAAPASVRDAARLLANQADAVDPASVLAQASGDSIESTALTTAGAAVSAAVSQSCTTPLNFAAAVPTGVSKRQVSPAAWSRTMCTSLSTWGHTVNDAGASLVTTANGQTTLPDVRNTLSQFLSKAVAATQQLNTELGGAGLPKTPNGAAFASSIRIGVSSALLVFVGAQPSVQTLPNDAAAFQVQAQALVTKLDTAGRSVEALVRAGEIAIKDRALATALARQPACAGIR